MTGALTRRGFFAEVETRIPARHAATTGRRRWSSSTSTTSSTINDRYGHSAGDAVLVSIANACMATMRKSDIFGRIGGEEFAPAAARDRRRGGERGRRTHPPDDRIDHRRGRRQSRSAPPSASASPRSRPRPKASRPGSAKPTSRSTRPSSSAATASSPARPAARSPASPTSRRQAARTCIDLPPRPRGASRAPAPAIAQLVEHLICNQGVTGSNPVAGTSMGRRPLRPVQRSPKSAGDRDRAQRPTWPSLLRPAPVGRRFEIFAAASPVMSVRRAEAIGLWVGRSSMAASLSVCRAHFRASRSGEFEEGWVNATAPGLPLCD